MSSTIEMAVPFDPEQGPASITSVDIPRHVSNEWRRARAAATMMTVRQVRFDPIEQPGERIHAGTPRRAVNVIEIYVNPDWVDTIRPGMYEEAAETWRAENDTATMAGDRA